MFKDLKSEILLGVVAFIFILLIWSFVYIIRDRKKLKKYTIQDGFYTEPISIGGLLWFVYIYLWNNVRWSFSNAQHKIFRQELYGDDWLISSSHKYDPFRYYMNIVEIFLFCVIFIFSIYIFYLFVTRKARFLLFIKFYLVSEVLIFFFSRLVRVYAGEVEFFEAGAYVIITALVATALFSYFEQSERVKKTFVN